MKTMAKLNEMYFELFWHSLYSLNLALCDYWLFADFNRMLQVKKLGSNEDVIGEIEVYFESKPK